MHLEPWQWAAALSGALLIGLSKTGFSGAGILMVAIFAQILPARASTGIVLPLLISADIIAVSTFRRHAVWRHLWGLFPWSAAGVVLGYLWMRHQGSDEHSELVFKHLIGGTLIVLSAVQLVRKVQSLSRSPSPKREGVPETSNVCTPAVGILGRNPPPASAATEVLNSNGMEVVEAEPLHRQASLAYLAVMGLSAGFTTMTANAAGPIMILYLMAAGLPKMEFVGTGAWYFLIINLFKVPFSANQGLINPTSLIFDVKLVPAVLAGAFSGRFLVSKINQNAFEVMALAFAVIGAVRLLW
jgi:hypothetical protein